jgi:hypothetical protein
MMSLMMAVNSRNLLLYILYVIKTFILLLVDGFLVYLCSKLLCFSSLRSTMYYIVVTDCGTGGFYNPWPRLLVVQHAPNLAE